ncbi:MAG: lipid-A-disaccharide synthase [Campylobacteraceae bacterium]|nr:lipid-A-disaccharide synthase [Campylobacteraceae bacterium]
MKLLVSALEPSANAHLEPILNSLESVELFGIFDPKFGSPLTPSSTFSVMGFWDVIPKIVAAKKAIDNLAKQCDNVDKVLLIDSPAFNLPLAKAIKKRNPNVDIIYYILPQVWAWKAKRVTKVERYCDNLASILPFELKWYKKAQYVGHPLLDELPPSRKVPLSPKAPIAFLPGSRRKEIARLMPIFRKLCSNFSNEKLLVIPPFVQKDKIEEIYGDISDFTPVFNTHEALKKSHFAFICSGTATLEAALLGIPFVLAYRANPLDFFIAKKFVKLPYAGLANIIFHFMGKPALHLELLQDEVNENSLLKAYKNVTPEDFCKGSRELRQYLNNGSASNITKLIRV